MEFHQLRYFESAARLGSMMAAAAECHVSQPALSVQIRKLEESAGAKLLIREARGVRLTPAGERTLLAARRILRESTGWEGDMRKGDFGGSRPIRVAVQPFLSSELLPKPLAESLRGSEGNLRLRFRERAPSVIPGVLRSGEVDFALVDLNTTPMGEFVTEVILRIPYALFVPKGHPLADSDAPVRLPELIGANLLLYSPSPGLEARLADAAGHGTTAWDPVFTSDNASGVFELVVAGVGVAVLPAVFKGAALRRGVVFRELADYAGEVVVAAAHRQDEQPRPALMAFLDNLRNLHHHRRKPRPAA